MIRGLQAMFYSSHAEELRAFLRDKLGFNGTDAGGARLIFDATGGDHSVHPTGNDQPPSGAAGISFCCDEIERTFDELNGRGVVLIQEVEDHAYGLVTHLRAPGNFKMQLYEPSYTN